MKRDLVELDDFLATARRRFTAASEDERELRRKFISDLRFASPDGDEQWDAQVKQQREAAGRPTLSFPRCHTFVRQVSNAARQNKPQIKFAPRLDEDKDTAEIYEGLARYIQYSSEAEIAYETAIEYSAAASFGYYRFITYYADDETDDLELKVMPVLDPLTVYGIVVPACFNRKPTYAFVVEDIPKEEFKQLYPKSETTSLGWIEAEKRGEGWIGSETVRVAEYWYTERKPGKGKRTKTSVKFCKTNGLEILPDPDGTSSETDWPGSSIPIIPVLGGQMIIEGKPNLFSVVRAQKAAQQLINYSKSRIAETLSTLPISPFMVAVGQIPSGKQKQWENLNKINTPFLEYSTVDVGGRPAPPPQRQTFEPPIQSLSAFVMQEVDDMKATAGIFDASLGQNGNETSGQAIARRQEQADLTTMHFMDNLVRSFRKGGEVIAEMIPKIYDSEREIQILGIDEKPKVVLINQEHVDPETGKTQNFDLTKGKYALTVTSGKAFDSKRSETFDTMQQVLATQPNLMNVIGDIFFRNSDMAGADQLAERFQKLLPPALQDNQQIPPEAQAAVAAAHQQMAGMQAELQKLAMDRMGKITEHQGKMQQIQLQHQADMDLEDKKLEAQLAVAEIETKAQNVQERLAFVEDMIKQLHSQAHESAMAAQNAAHSQIAQQAAAEQQQAQMAQQQAGEQQQQPVQ